MKTLHTRTKLITPPSLYHYALISSTLLINILLSQQIYASIAPTEQPTNSKETTLKPENTPAPSTPQACTAIEADAVRLACYDTALGRQPQPSTPVVATTTAADTNNSVIKLPKTSVSKSTTNNDDAKPLTLSNFFDTTNTTTESTPLTPTTSLLDKRWELSPESKLGTFTLRANRPVYLLPSFYSSSPNRLPTSPNPDNQVSTPLDIDHNEAKFQLSLKFKTLENILNTHGDLWFGYTQTSHWQIFNAENSRPFRETNYEPEASLIFPTQYNFLGLNGHLLGFTLDHQSNGRSNPLSRSWNRAMLNIGLERGDWVVMIRPWYRIPENKSNDDNPDISNYIGRGDIQITRKWNGHEFSLMLRHSLKEGSNSHGAAQFDWSFPIHNNLRGFAQIFTGYGESLIDYNHDSTSVGLGISLLNWY